MEKEYIKPEDLREGDWYFTNISTNNPYFFKFSNLTHDKYCHIFSSLHIQHGEARSFRDTFSSSHMTETIEKADMSEVIRYFPQEGIKAETINDNYSIL